MKSFLRSRKKMCKSWNSHRPKWCLPSLQLHSKIAEWSWHHWQNQKCSLSHWLPPVWRVIRFRCSDDAEVRRDFCDSLDNHLSSKKPSNFHRPMCHTLHFMRPYHVLVGRKTNCSPSCVITINRCRETELHCISFWRRYQKKIAFLRETIRWLSIATKIHTAPFCWRLKIVEKLTSLKRVFLKYSTISTRKTVATKNAVKTDAQQTFFRCGNPKITYQGRSCGASGRCRCSCCTRRLWCCWNGSIITRCDISHVHHETWRSLVTVVSLGGHVWQAKNS